MLKALFLDMDETLCDTTLANQQASIKMAELFESFYSKDNSQNTVNSADFTKQYLKGIYRDFSPKQKTEFLPINCESEFRRQLIHSLLRNAGIKNIDDEHITSLQNSFDQSRTQFFDFYPGIAELLTALRKQFCLVVITNGPEFSQITKIERVHLTNYVDHIIIGGQEPEQKPAKSIFDRALTLAHCKAEQAMHFGDSLTTDILGANNAGIRSVWIRHGQPNNKNICPDFTIEHPQDIPHFIRQHTQAAI